MKVYSADNQLVENPDLSLGHLEKDSIFIMKHPAVEEVQEEWHYTTVQTYPNGGKDVIKVIDVPYVAPQEEWDEYENIWRYILYTPEELAAIEEEKNKPSQEERIRELEEALEMLISGVTE